MATKETTRPSGAYEQYIFYKQKATFTTAYHQFWGVLQRESRSGKKRIELFDLDKSTKYPVATINIIDMLHVMKRDAKAHRHGFQILAMGNKYHFAARNTEECSEWIDAINKIMFGPPETGVEYEYRVRVLKNIFSTDLSLTGLYLLVVKDEELVLNSTGGLFPSRFHCNLNQVENVVKLSKSSFVINTMSSSAVGKGMFTFDSSSASDIVKTINYRMRGQNQSDEWILPKFHGMVPTSGSQSVSKHSTTIPKRAKIHWNSITSKPDNQMSIPKSATIEALSPLQELHPFFEDPHGSAISSEEVNFSGDEQASEQLTKRVEHHRSLDNLSMDVNSASSQWSSAVTDSDTCSSRSSCGSVSVGTTGRAVADSTGHSIIDVSSPDANSSDKFGLQRARTHRPILAKSGSVQPETSLDSSDTVLRQMWRDKRHCSFPTDQERAVLAVAAASLQQSDKSEDYINTNYIHNLVSLKEQDDKAPPVPPHKHQFLHSFSSHDFPHPSSPLLEGRFSPERKPFSAKPQPRSRSATPSPRASPSITPHHSPTKKELVTHSEEEDVDIPQEDSYDSIDTWIPGWKKQKTQRLQKIQMSSLNHSSRLKHIESEEEKAPSSSDEDDPLMATYLEVLPDHHRSQQATNKCTNLPKSRSPTTPSQISPIPRRFASISSSGSPLWPHSGCSSPAGNRRVENWEDPDDSDEEERYTRVEKRTSRSLGDIMIGSTAESFTLLSQPASLTSPLPDCPSPQHQEAAATGATADQSDNTGECITDWLAGKTDELPYQILASAKGESSFRKSQSVRRPSTDKERKFPKSHSLTRRSTSSALSIPRQSTSSFEDPIYASIGSDVAFEEPVPTSPVSDDDGYSCLDDILSLSKTSLAVSSEISPYSSVKLGTGPQSLSSAKTTSTNETVKRESHNYEEYDYPYMDMEQQRKEQRKRMVLEMLRRMEPDEEGTYIGLPKPEVAPRPNLDSSASARSMSLRHPERKLSSDREDIYEVLSPSEFPMISPEAPSIPPHHPLLSPNLSWTHPSPLPQHKSVLQSTKSSMSLV